MPDHHRSILLTTNRPTNLLYPSSPTQHLPPLQVPEDALLLLLLVHANNKVNLCVGNGKRSLDLQNPQPRVVVLPKFVLILAVWCAHSQLKCTLIPDGKPNHSTKGKALVLSLSLPLRRPMFVATFPNNLTKYILNPISSGSSATSQYIHTGMSIFYILDGLLTQTDDEHQRPMDGRLAGRIRQ